MAVEIVRRMVVHGRADDVTNVVYPGAGHVFLVQDFLPPRGPGTGPPVDFGGSTKADIVAGKGTWQRIPSFLQAGDPLPPCSRSVGGPSPWISKYMSNPLTAA